MTVAIASDHAGYALKNVLVDYIKELGFSIDDLGCDSEESVDYPVYAEKLCRALVAGKYDRGILVCGTGIGMSMAANKIPGIRAALCSDCYCAEMTRKHNDANVLCLGGRVLGTELAKKIVDTYLSSGFSGAESHSRRIAMIKDLEK